MAAQLAGLLELSNKHLREQMSRALLQTAHSKCNNRRLIANYKLNVRILTILLLLTTLWASHTSADVSLPGNGTQPVRVAMSIYLIDLAGIDNVNQNFEANVFYIVNWNDPRLAHSGTGEISRPRNEVWHPRLLILNQQRTLKTFPEVVKIDPQGNVTYRQRLWGKFSQPLNLRNFPFDHQQLQITAIAVGYTPEEVEIVSHSRKSSGIEKNLSIPDWDLIDWKVEHSLFRPDTELIDTMASFTYSFTVERRHHFYVAKVIIPLVLIMAMSWVVFWMDPEKGGGTQIGISVTAILTLTAYTFATSASLPRVPYLTRLDYFILSSMVLVFLALVEAAVSSPIRLGAVAWNSHETSTCGRVGSFRWYFC